jgi:hypothetical protein
VTDEEPFKAISIWCPNCRDLREENEFEFVELVKELGNISRYHCKICDSVFELLPPSFLPDDVE